jgi:tRNA A58 N-methylase Trm61
MKKYAELMDVYMLEEHHINAMFTDLQATVRALEVAREALQDANKYVIENELIEAIQHIDKTLGKAGL